MSQTHYIPRLITPAIDAVRGKLPVILVTGPRQSGKSTLCRHIFPDFNYANLENIRERVAAIKDPEAFIEGLGDHVIIDEVQRVPELLSLVQVRVDTNPECSYVLTGSCNFALLNTVSQSLAGRVAQFTLMPFSYPEMIADIETVTTDELLFKGMFPRLWSRDIDPETYYTGYYNTYVERDIRDLLNIRNLAKFDTFVRLLASRTGSEFNAASLAKEAGVSAPTVAEWMSMLTASYIVTTLRPYHNNIGKTLTKMPKVYFADTGLLCYLLGIDSAEVLARHAMRGAVFENAAVTELIKQRCNAGREPRVFFYREPRGREVDALSVYGGATHLYEVKSSKTLRPEWYDNLAYLSDLIPGPVTTAIVYDGPTLGTALNLRNI